MSKPEPWPVSLTVFCVLFGIFWLWVSFLMMARPQRYVEWFLNKPYRWCGLQISIVDEQRFKRIARFYLVLPFLFGGLGLMVALVAGHR